MVEMVVEAGTTRTLGPSSLTTLTTGSGRTVGGSKVPRVPDSSKFCTLERQVSLSKIWVMHLRVVGVRVLVVGVPADNINPEEVFVVNGIKELTSGFMMMV